MSGRLEKLEAFFKEVAQLTVDHNIVVSGADEIAVVYPKDLGAALEKVDPEWYEHV